MFESKSGIFLVAGIGFFALAFLSNALVPAMMYRHLPEKQVKELINGNLRYQFEDLAMRYPESFKAAYDGGPPEDPAKAELWYNEKCAEALTLGRKIYTGEGCWHCHSQFVRPVSNEDRRWGPVSKTWEYQNELQRPVMFGTRRVGPDLSREGGRRSNDWQAVHLFKPTTLSPGSPMPEYPWLFDGAPDKLNKRGFAVLTYLQWLGSWHETYPYYEDYEATKIQKSPKADSAEAEEPAADVPAAEATSTETPAAEATPEPAAPQDASQN